MLENKLGLHISADLAREEERISKAKAMELFETGLLDRLEAGCFSTLQAIHKHLFGDIYDFTGQIRTGNTKKHPCCLIVLIDSTDVFQFCRPCLSGYETHHIIGGAV